VDRVVRRAVAALALAGARVVGPGPAPAMKASAQTTTTTLPADHDDRSVIPAPNSGREPEASGDRGGWAQLTVFGIMAAGSAVIFGRVLWAAHQKSRSDRVT
jgi:hypothetical protein